MTAEEKMALFEKALREWLKGEGKTERTG